MAKPKRVPITMRALLQRINRKLALEGRAGQGLKAMRGGARDGIGDYYLLDFDTNFISNPNVDPEALGRKLGVLAEWEELAQ